MGGALRQQRIRLRGDPFTEVRETAWCGLARSPFTPSLACFSDALSMEHDQRVQRARLSCLAEHPHPMAIATSSLPGGIAAHRGGHGLEQQAGGETHGGGAEGQIRFSPITCGGSTGCARVIERRRRTVRAERTHHSFSPCAREPTSSRPGGRAPLRERRVGWFLLLGRSRGHRGPPGRRAQSRNPC